MGISWGNCPSSINDQVEGGGFSSSRFPGICGHRSSGESSQKNEHQREKERTDGERKRARKGYKGVLGARYFHLRGQSLVIFHKSWALIRRFPEVSAQTCTLFVSLLFPLSPTVFLSSGEEGVSCPETRVKVQWISQISGL